MPFDASWADMFGGGAGSGGGGGGGSALDSGLSIASAIPGPHQPFALGGKLVFGALKSLFGRKAAKRKAEDEYKRNQYRTKQASKNRNIGMGWLALLENANRATRSQQGRAAAPSFFGDAFRERFAPGGQIDLRNFDAEEIPKTSTPGFWGSALEGAFGGAENYMDDEAAAGREAQGRVGGIDPRLYMSGRR